MNKNKIGLTKNNVKEYFKNLNWKALIIGIIISILLTYIFKYAGIWLIVGSLIIGILLNDHEQPQYLVFYSIVLACFSFVLFYYEKNFNLQSNLDFLVLCIILSYVFIWLGTVTRPYIRNYEKEVSNANSKVLKKEKKNKK